MASLLTLERRMKNWQILSNEQAKETFSKTNKDLADRDHRQKVKDYKRLAFAGFSVAANDEEKGIEITNAAIEAIQAAMHNNVTIEMMGPALGAFYAHKLEQTGVAECSTISNSRRRVISDTATLCVSESADLAQRDLQSSFSEISRKDFSKAVRIGLGADGRYSLELRYVDAVRPQLELAEYKRVLYASPTGRLGLTNGQTYFGAAEDITKGAVLKVPVGTYALQFFALGTVNTWKMVAVISQSKNNVPYWTSEPKFEF
ncbi:MAG: hypothetical protein QNJ29_03375 [Rhizobiaceae bacterium]|nr:hypothetical protein [Rhizobiaceae bacterium]